jgi:hypothetical protein
MEKRRTPIQQAHEVCELCNIDFKKIMEKQTRDVID